MLLHGPKTMNPILVLKMLVHPILMYPILVFPMLVHPILVDPILSGRIPWLFTICFIFTNYKSSHIHEEKRCFCLEFRNDTRHSPPRYYRPQHLRLSDQRNAITDVVVNMLDADSYCVSSAIGMREGSPNSRVAFGSVVRAPIANVIDSRTNKKSWFTA